MIYKILNKLYDQTSNERKNIGGLIKNKECNSGYWWFFLSWNYSNTYIAVYMYTCIAVFKMSTCYIKKEACCYNNKVKEMKKLEKPQKYSGLIETQCNLETFFCWCFL